METNQHSQSEEGETWVQTPNITINGDDNDDDDDDDDGDGDGDDEGLCALKREIASHSLYGLLVQSHFNCFKLCLGNMEDVITNEASAVPSQHANLFRADQQSELDQFMEAYCVTLKKLKEAMEEPQQESMAFINLMYSQLDNLLLDNIPSTKGTEKAELT